MEYEKNYSKLLLRLDEETRRKLNNYQENQHEAPEFQKKLISGEKTIEEMNLMKQNENKRFVERLKVFQRKKYEATWKVCEDFNKRVSMATVRNRGQAAPIKKSTQENLAQEQSEEESKEKQKDEAQILSLKSSFFDTPEQLKTKKSTNKEMKRIL